MTIGKYIGEYKIYDREKNTFVGSIINGLKEARKRRDELNEKFHGKLEKPINPNNWRYCLKKYWEN